MALEAAGIALAGVSLATTFNACIEAFSYLKAAQSLERDLQILLVKLDMEKARLLSWGNSVGIVRALNDGRNPILENGQTAETIKRTLEGIYGILTDSNQLRDCYALCEVSEPSEVRALQSVELVSSTSMTIFRRSWNRMRNRPSVNRNQLSVPNRIIWAIRDRERFACLITDLRELVDGLLSLLPPQLQSAGSRIIEDDIASLRPSSLHLILDAFQGDEQYQALSDVASEAIGASQDYRAVEEWMEDEIPEETTSQPPEPARAQQGSLEIPRKHNFRNTKSELMFP